MSLILEKHESKMPDTCKNDDEVVENFLKLARENEDMSSGIVAIKTLLMILEKSQ
uniref:Uncharacterized protein n=1 Tax=Megaselia scalaris TaxID=36166 RepID=T1H060_MEGSC